MSIPVMAVYHIADNLLSGRSTAATPPSQPRGELEDLRQRLDRHNLVIQTLLMLLLEKKVIHEDEFKQWMAYVDEFDGVRDGKLRDDKSPQECPQCRRKTPRSSIKCAYCGAEMPQEFLRKSET